MIDPSNTRHVMYLDPHCTLELPDKLKRFRIHLGAILPDFKHKLHITRIDCHIKKYNSLQQFIILIALHPRAITDV